MLVVGTLASLPAALISPWLLLIPVSCLAAAIFLNRRFYNFLAEKGGWAFAAGATPLHLFYYLAATIGWFMGRTVFLFQQVARKK